MKIGFVLYVLMLHQVCLGQKSNLNFRLKGKINVDTGTATLVMLTDEEFQSIGVIEYKNAKIDGGKFSFAGHISAPIILRLKVSSGSKQYRSDYFYINPGNQFIKCNIDSVREIPLIANTSMNEMLSFHINTINRRELLKYVRLNPNSFVAFWETVKRFSTAPGFSIDTIFNEFSAAIKGSKYGRGFDAKLQVARFTYVGSLFPDFRAYNLRLNKIMVNLRNSTSKYILVDFWFSHCMPCFEQFPGYKKLYASYRRPEFDIVAISIDKASDTDAWKSAISNNDLLWTQYLDKDGKFANYLSISSFPTNFLLNAEGRIVKRDITLNELEVFLNNQNK